MSNKILVIDDEGLVTKSLQRMLKIEGYDVIIANSGKEAIEKVKTLDFDLIVADIRMPELSGIDTIKKIRQITIEVGKRPIPEIVITGYADEDYYKKAVELKVADYIYKPFDRDAFLKTIQAHLGAKKPTEHKETLAVDNKTLIDNFIKEQSKQNKRLLSNKTSPIIGWVNSYVPEEIIIAAGFLPYRIMGAPIALNLSKTYLSGNLCSSVQSILECVLKGDYKFLDGMIIGASTDATKRLYDVWTRYASTPFCHLFDIPKFINENAIIHYAESVHSLIEEIEKYFKIKISNSAIKEAILICNKTRKFLSDLNNLRKMDNPPVTSQQFLEICKLAVASEKKKFNNSLEMLLKQLKPEEREKQYFRILLTGSFQDQPWLLNIIEERGARVVCEDLCTRLRYFSGLIEKDGSPIENIAKRYIEIKPASANLVSLDQRINHILQLIKEFRIDGVVYYILKFDDPYLFEFPDMREALVSNNIPVLCIETEHNTSAMGQIMTRVQAFMETLKLAKSRGKAAQIMK